MFTSSELPSQVSNIIRTPYWQVTIRPERFLDERLAYKDLLSIIERLQVRLRGWYFPHVSNRPEENIRGKNYISTWSTAFENEEYWRFYQSAQLVHLHGVEEAHEYELSQRISVETQRKLKWLKRDWSSVNGYLDIINFLYTVTEIFEFASRLALLLKLEDSVFVEIALHNISGFVLTTLDSNRAWSNFYIWQEQSLSNNWSIQSDKITVNSAAISRAAVEWFFNRFGWEDVNLSALGDAQAAFLRKRP